MIFLFCLCLYFFVSPLSGAMAIRQPLQTPGNNANAAVVFHDIKDVVPLPDFSNYWYWIGGSILLLLLLAFFFLYNKKRRQRKKSSQEPAHIRALNALSSAKTIMTPEHSRAFAIRLAEIIRSYIEERYTLSLNNLTTREFMAFVSKEKESPQIPADLSLYQQMLEEWMNHCDMVKFARYRLTEQEMESMYHTVADFITTTRAEETAQ